MRQRMRLRELEKRAHIGERDVHFLICTDLDGRGWHLDAVTPERTITFKDANALISFGQKEDVSKEQIAELIQQMGWQIPLSQKKVLLSSYRKTTKRHGRKKKSMISSSDSIGDQQSGR